MVPQHFVELDAMPQTNNGKIDYKSLPAPSTEVAEPAETCAPNSPAEKYLASVWEEVLETDDVDLNDTFFDIGGHSLLVMKVISTVHDKTGIKLGPQDFLMTRLPSRLRLKTRTWHRKNRMIVLKLLNLCQKKKVAEKRLIRMWEKKRRECFGT
jgi:acyl carrier protein